MKLMIISWIIFLVIFVCAKAMAFSIDDNEKLIYKLTGALPVRVSVLSLLVVPSFIECIVVTIIFVVNL